jgi:hypothetical protein
MLSAYLLVPGQPSLEDNWREDCGQRIAEMRRDGNRKARMKAEG